MIKGLYAAFTAMEAAWRYQDVLANNIANVNTAGFKREVGAMQSFSDVLLSQQAPVPAPIAARIQAVVGQIGTGKFIAEFATDFQQGAFQATDNELDLATDKGFFAIQTPDGATYFTRDGRFNRDAAGDLVTSHGYYVLDADGQHINLPAQRVDIGLDGAITREGQPIAQLQLRDFTPGQLLRAGEGYFRSAAPGTPVTGGVRQGFIERSNTNMVEDLTTLLAVQRTYQANQTIIARLDDTLEQAAGQLGQFGR
ncbi:MAG: flagellar hook-basal body protein [Dehalococcoidia bacterium]